MRRRTTIATSLTALSLAALSACAPATSSGGSCDDFTSYMPTATTPPSFATDLYPLFSDTNETVNGCGQTTICHGAPPMTLDPAMTKTLVFTTSAASAKAALLENSVNAPNMKRVVPGNVGASFLAYKIAKDRSGLACVNSMCVAGASVGNNAPCGDLMPNLGELTDAQRTKILDWIALGAAD